MSTKVEQLLHGYRRGHEQLAGSVRVSARDAELLARLSDLSGTLAGSVKFDPYLTVYPLPSRSYFAVAQTWLDLQAPRGGCVVTHTLLVPFDAWCVASRPSDLATLFRFPLGRTDYESYGVTLSWPSDVWEVSAVKPLTSIDAHVEFVFRYFAEGKQPIIWFGNPDPASTLWLLLNGLWPALRARFASCTLCLQPRTLEDRPFDLMFAPAEAYPRFLKIDPDHLLNSSRPPSIPSSDEWCHRWAQRLFASRSTVDVPVVDLWADLDDDPTAIRRLYLVDTAMRTYADAPQAAVGAMDLVESVARSPDAAIQTKAEIATRAVSVAAAAREPADGLESLRLIEDRLRHPAYARVSPRIGPLITRAVAMSTQRNPELVASSSHGAADISADEETSWYGRGLLEGFRQLSEEAPGKLIVLRELPAISAQLFATEPEIAIAYTHALFLRRDMNDVRKTLHDWLASATVRELRPALRQILLPAVTVDDSDLLPDLLKGLPDGEVAEALDAIRGALPYPSVAKLIEQLIAQEHPIPTRDWARRIKKWGWDLAPLVAATYTSSRRGMAQLLDEGEFTGEQRALVLTTFLERVSRGGFPAWLGVFASEDPRIFVTLLYPRAEQYPSVDTALGQLLNECDGAPLAHMPEVLHGVLKSKGRSFFKLLLDMTLRDLVRGYLDGTVREEDALPLLASEDAGQWMRSTPHSELRSLLTHDIWNRPENWLHAWQLMLSASGALYELDPAPVPEVIESLLRAYHKVWSPVVAKHWTEILRRARQDCPLPHARLTLTVQALKFALNNTHLPLSALVAEIFFDVYSAVTTAGGPAPEVSCLFGYFDWDKGKELRKSLIDAFLYSKWPPGDLSIAAHDPELFRKIFKRVLRKQSGEQYLHSMLSDLQTREQPDARRMAQQLESLLNKPDFYEEWD